MLIRYLAVLCLISSVSCFADSPEELAARSGPLEMMPRSLEVRFALSALPAVLREKSAVYVLDPAKGYSLDHAGTNGQNCFVERTEWRREEYRNDIYTPICYDAAGAKAQMRVWFETAEMRAKGIAPAAMKKEMENRFKIGVYKAPERAGLSYMTAPLMRTYLNPDPAAHDVVTLSMPHLMFYAPNLTDADMGGVPPMSPYPFIFEQGPQGYMIEMIGTSERAAIVASNKELLKDLCTYRKYLCLNHKSSPRPSH